MKILMIVEPDRTDWYHYLTLDKRNDYLLLWYEDDCDVPEEIRQNCFFKKIFSWASFVTPQQLLKKIQPDRIVFFEVIDHRQIALMVTANKLRIKTFYLEHGAAGDKDAAILRANEKNYFSKTKAQYLLGRFKNGMGRLIKSKMFYYSASLQLLSFSSTLKYIKLPFTMLFNTPNKALANCTFPEHTPYRSIVFNKPNFEQFQVYTGIREESAVFSGVPIFDHFHYQIPTEDYHITYIEHPYLEAGILNWTPEHHKYIARILYDFCINRQMKILVKLHPRADMSLWKSYGFESPLFEIVQDGEFSKEMMASKLILAYSSSLVNGFLCAQKNVVLLGWQPEPKIFGADFSKTGLCHVSLSPSDMDNRFDFWVSHNLSKDNNEKYENFLRVFNFPFDGKASERVLNAIVEDEVC
jgi:hypothetical protein